MIEYFFFHRLKKLTLKFCPYSHTRFPLAKFQSLSLTLTFNIPSPQYGWLVSGAFLSGAEPVLVLLVIWSALQIVIFGYLAW